MPTGGATTLDSSSIHRLTSDLLLPLSSANSTLSSDFLLRLLDSFLLLQEHLLLLLLGTPTTTISPRLISDLLDRSLKSLDLLNAVRDGIHHLRRSASLADLASSSPPSQPRRTLRALADLTVSLIFEQTPVPTRRHRSFPRRRTPPSSGTHHSRSHSFSVSRSWSASRQLHTLAATLAPPPRGGGDPVTVAAYTTNYVLVLATLALVAAIPCQDRSGLHLVQLPSPPRCFAWSAAVATVHEKILEEARGRGGRKATAGLLLEARAVESAATNLEDAIEAAAPTTAMSTELHVACDELNKGLNALETKVREVFHRIATCRVQILEGFGEGEGH